MQENLSGSLIIYGQYISLRKILKKHFEVFNQYKCMYVYYVCSVYLHVNAKNICTKL